MATITNNVGNTEKNSEMCTGIVRYVKCHPVQGICTSIVNHVSNDLEL